MSALPPKPVLTPADCQHQLDAKGLGEGNRHTINHLALTKALIEKVNAILDRLEHSRRSIELSLDAMSVRTCQQTVTTTGRGQRIGHLEPPKSGGRIEGQTYRATATRLGISRDSPSITTLPDLVNACSRSHISVTERKWTSAAGRGVVGKDSLPLRDVGDAERVAGGVISPGAAVAVTLICLSAAARSMAVGVVVWTALKGAASIGGESIMKQLHTQKMQEREE